MPQLLARSCRSGDSARASSRIEEAESSTNGRNYYLTQAAETAGRLQTPRFDPARAAQLLVGLRTPAQVLARGPARVRGGHGRLVALLLLFDADQGLPGLLLLTRPAL